MLEDADKLIVEQELPDVPSIKTMLVLGAPAVVDCEDLSPFAHINALFQKY